MISHSHTWYEPDLFILADEQLVEQTENVSFKVCMIEKALEPVIEPDRPWEGKLQGREPDSLQDPFYATVLHDSMERLFHCWYRPLNRYLSNSYRPPFVNQESKLCYARSRDGIHWDKPSLRQVLYQGSLDNNMLRIETPDIHGAQSVADSLGSVIPFSTTTQPTRYAGTLHSTFADPIYSKGIAVCFSPDGLHWKMQFPPVIPLDGDAHTVSWDPRDNVFILTTRSSQHANLCGRWGRRWRRHIALAKSRDFIRWTPTQTVLEIDSDDPDDAEIYMMHIIPYGHAYLGQMLMFYSHEMVLDNQWAISHDLSHWRRLRHQVVLERGAEGAWDSKHVTLSKNLPHPEGNLMRFWYGGASAPHYQAGYGALGTGTLRRDGFACYQAGDSEGTVTTVPMRVQTTTLALNVDATDGEVRVEVLDRDCNPIEGYRRQDCLPIRGDFTRALVEFTSPNTKDRQIRNRLSFEQSEIRFRFHLKRAELYAFKASGGSPQWL